MLLYFLLQKMFKKKQSDPLWREMINELKELREENGTLKLENAELREINNKLKQSLDESVARVDRPQSTAVSADSELQQRLNRTVRQLREARKQLLSSQERLTVSEQVNAATLRRELRQEGVYHNLPKGSAYENLRFDPTQKHMYNKLRTHAGLRYCCLQ